MHATVHFRIRDVIHPSPLQLLSQLFGEEPLQGEVVAITDDGREPGSFMVIKVPGVGEPLIVPAQKVQACPEPKILMERRCVPAVEKMAPELTTRACDLRLP